MFWHQSHEDHVYLHQPSDSICVYIVYVYIVIRELRSIIVVNCSLFIFPFIKNGWFRPSHTCNAKLFSSSSVLFVLFNQIVPQCSGFACEIASLANNASFWSLARSSQLANSCTVSALFLFCSTCNYVILLGFQPATAS